MQLYMGTKVLISEDMFCGLMKLLGHIDEWYF